MSHWNGSRTAGEDTIEIVTLAAMMGTLGIVIAFTEGEPTCV
jgi:hypothetical protein